MFWRISFCYILSLFILGLIVPSDDENLLNASGAHTKYSPFVIAIRLAGIKVLPSIFNAIITISVISVANSCTFASTRTMQALAERGMAPKFLAYVDKKGRPIWGIVIQLAFGLIAFVGESNKEGTVFNWLLALSGLSNFFVWASICLAHIRFRSAWKAQGHVKAELPYEAMFGVVGSWYGMILNIVCLIATFYVALFVSLPIVTVRIITNYTASPLAEASARRKISSPTISLPQLCLVSTLDGSSIRATGGFGSQLQPWTLPRRVALSNLTQTICLNQRHGEMPP